ncbi:MAG: hypothetical protein Q8O79_05165 [Pseudomonadota bacterium]|nr:hypothetical protein [Pseudomonadota bacterium]
MQYRVSIVVLLSVLFLPGLLAGCASTSNSGSSCGVFGIPGNIEFKMRKTGAYCNVSAVYSNTSGGVVRPYIKYIAFDADNNTLDESAQYFDSILPGKIQEKDINVSGGACRVKKISVFTANHDSGGNYVPIICGVSGTTHTFQ